MFASSPQRTGTSWTIALDILLNLPLQRRCQHLQRPLPGELIHVQPQLLFRTFSPSDNLEHGWRLLPGLHSRLLVVEIPSEGYAAFLFSPIHNFRLYLVIHAFSSLVGGNSSNWAVDAWKDSLHDGLATVFASDDREALSVATEFVHRLGRLGYFEFRPLLDSSGD